MQRLRKFAAGNYAGAPRNFLNGWGGKSHTDLNFEVSQRVAVAEIDAFGLRNISDLLFKKREEKRVSPLFAGAQIPPAVRAKRRPHISTLPAFFASEDFLHAGTLA